jgi:hypothetical protein
MILAREYSTLLGGRLHDPCSSPGTTGTWCRRNNSLEQGMIERPDEAHFIFAAQANRTLYSFNVGDFYHLHGKFLAENRHHAGLILSRQQQFTVGEQLRRRLKLIATVPAEEMKNRVEFLSAWG